MVVLQWLSFSRTPSQLREILPNFAMRPIAVPFARRWHLENYPQLTMPNMRLSLISKQLNREVIAAFSVHNAFFFHTVIIS